MSDMRGGFGQNWNQADGGYDESKYEKTPLGVKFGFAILFVICTGITLAQLGFQIPFFTWVFGPIPIP